MRLATKPERLSGSAWEGEKMSVFEKTLAPPGVLNRPPWPTPRPALSSAPPLSHRLLERVLPGAPNRTEQLRPAAVAISITSMSNDWALLGRTGVRTARYIMCCAAWRTFGDRAGQNTQSARVDRLTNTPSSGNQKLASEGNPGRKLLEASPARRTEANSAATPVWDTARHLTWDTTPHGSERRVTSTILIPVARCSALCRQRSTRYTVCR